MEALVKGSHAPRVAAVCVKCGSTFERSAVHPYIMECPGCRGAAAAERKAEKDILKRVRCKGCRALVASALPLGMHQCGTEKCDGQWWSLGNGWWRNVDTDDVFRLGRLMGSLKESPFDEVFRGVRDDPVVLGT